MTQPITRVTLFVPGTPPSERAWADALRRDGLRFEGGALRGGGVHTDIDVVWIANDGSFASAFPFGTVGPEAVATIAAAPGALVLHVAADLREGRSQIIEVVERLRDAGALAVRLEQSGIGWEVARWLELFASPDPWAWHRCTIVFLDEDDAVQSCGMHAFSLPDVRVPRDGDPAALRELATLLNLYQIVEDPVLLSGQTFAPDRETPRRVVERWPDTQYPPDHPCHNPYGVWRLGAPGGTARPSGEVLPVFVPPLRAVLAAVEQQARKPLTRQQVEATRDQAACIAMSPLDAQKLERSRGYADLDAELAWEQWQLVRSHGA